MDNIQFKTTVTTSDELPEEMKGGTVLIDNSDFSDKVVEEEIHVMEKELTEALENIKSIDEIIDESEMDERDKTLVRDVMTNGMDFRKIQEEGVKRHIEEVFSKTNKELQKLLPYFYTTNKEEITLNTPLLDILCDGITYYLKDEYKELKHSAKGDKDYNLYFLDILKMNIVLENISFKDENDEDIKSKIILDYFSLYKSIEEIIVQHHNEDVESNAYITAIDSVFNLEKEEFVENLKKEFQDIMLSEFDKGKLPRFKKLFYDTLVKKKKKVDISLRKQFSELLDDLGGLFLIAVERIILHEDKDFFQHVEDVNNNISKNEELTKQKMTYFISRLLRFSYLNKNLRWTLVSIEKQLYGAPFEENYLLAKFFMISELLSPVYEELKSRNN